MLDAAGFTLVDHQTSVPSLDNPAVLDGAYTCEALNLVHARSELPARAAGAPDRR
jgi:hypothetical protein